MARSSFSDQLSRNFPRNQGGTNRERNRLNANARDLQQMQVITIICLPPGFRSVLAQAQLVAMRNSGTGYQFPSGFDSVGSIPCSTNFNSKDELLKHLRQYFSSLEGCNTPRSWYVHKRFRYQAHFIFFLAQLLRGGLLPRKSGAPYL